MSKIKDKMKSKLFADKNRSKDRRFRSNFLDSSDDKIGKSYSYSFDGDKFIFSDQLAGTIAGSNKVLRREWERGRERRDKFLRNHKDVLEPFINERVKFASASIVFYATFIVCYLLHSLSLACCFEGRWCLQTTEERHTAVHCSNCSRGR